jgi:pilus assembly protein Flp/PilA
MLSRLTSSVARFLNDEGGPTAVEYAVMLVLILVVCILAVTALGSTTRNTFSYVGSQVSNTGS